MSNTNPIHSVQNTLELFADPVHFPITIGNDNFILTQQDQRNILDRRTWYLTHIPNQLQPPPQNDLPQLLQQLVTILGQLQPGDGAQPSDPFWFHYEKQTSTEDLAYHLRRIGLPMEPTTLVKHVHFVVDRTSRDKGTGMVDVATLSPDENRMVCESDEGNAETSKGSREAVGGALDRIRRAKEAGSEFW
ncbi:uncharacterized protein LOC128093269 [Culex pipiens pallens]|uniref:uncharacterized protein LOC128093269 n=1 Tax=Culex pipiens pallens TaxID=42434 RepID=UPI0022AA8596|nr:uncharacterized protein LOC128093269 [Culex pipiens pallens]